MPATQQRSWLLYATIRLLIFMTFHVILPPLYGVPRKCVPAVALLSTADGVSKKCIARANESEQECNSCKYLVWALGQLSQTDAHG